MKRKNTCHRWDLSDDRITEALNIVQGALNFDEHRIVIIAAQTRDWETTRYTGYMGSKTHTLYHSSDDDLLADHGIHFVHPFFSRRIPMSKLVTSVALLDDERGFMHELSLCRSIGSIVERAAEGRHVAVVEIEVGHLRQVVPETLVHCWTLLTDGTDLEGARLEIHEIPGILTCGDCGKETTLVGSPILECGFCMSRGVNIISGEEFMVTSLILED